MQRLAIAQPRQELTWWVDHVVAGVLRQSPTLDIGRSELWELLDGLPVAILISTDRDCRRIVGNVAARSLLRVPLGNNISQSADESEERPFAVYRDGVPAAPETLPMQVAARTGVSVANSECEVRFGDGTSVVIAGHSIPIRDGQDEVCGSIGAFIDVTAQRALLDQAQIVAGEMEHRAKNIFALVQSLARQTLGPLLEPEVLDTFESRLVALSRHQELLAAGDGSPSSLDELVIGTVAGVLADRIGRLSMSGPEVALPYTVALNLSLVFHELATNAVKYGALSGRKGSVEVDWRVEDNAEARLIALSWIERGGPQVGVPKRFGFGTRMMRVAARKLPRGTIDLGFVPEGLCVTVRFEAAAKAPVVGG